MPAEIAARRPATLTLAAPAPGTYLRLVAPVFVVLLALGLASAAAVHETASPLLQSVSKLFLFDRERNLPTLFNFSLLLANAGFCLLAATLLWRSRDGWRWSWLSLSGILFLMAFDEAAQIHERAGFLGRYLVEPTGALTLSWVVVGALAVGIVGIAYLRFVLALPAPVLRRVFAAAALFVCGALGVEMIAAGYAEVHGIQSTTTYELLATLEESLEMAGMIVFGLAVLTFLRSRDVQARSLV